MAKKQENRCGFHRNSRVKKGKFVGQYGLREEKVQEVIDLAEALGMSGSKVGEIAVEYALAHKKEVYSWHLQQKMDKVNNI